ncbi:saxiphilin-like isoform X2 [Eleutherodactylus coqui]|uniref:saxiphilin-like isoform X2 n=1 Tax=Eleutherodactylus coqui TaxID=57060 RepID=UPI003461EED5
MGHSSHGVQYEIRMTPAFQLLLCLCLLGLSYTAPQGRNVRWCVTSDIEDKKCNDLANSCTINEIHLKCVKKSSTSDCMKAISDGEADAISLDGEDIYKASLNPFNLKPIMVESHYHRDLNLADLSPCQKERQHVPKGGQPLLGAFVPECDEWDNYSPKQCHGSTGYCWCVNEDGKEIDGTRTPPTQKSPTCEDQKSTRCLRHRHSALRGNKPKIGAYVPECDEKGNYVPSQCHGTKGHCWCVKPNGETIEETRTAPYKVPTKCEEYIAKNLPCLKERQEALGGGHPLPGAFVPNCDEKGNYNPKQCHGSTGYCWCVNKNGQKINGTETPPGQPSPTCEEEKSTPCLKHRQRLLGGNKPKIGAFVPKCDEKGDYIPKQCHGSTGQCWCVNTDGEEIAGTRTGPGKAPPTCEDAAKKLPCLKERQEALGGGHPVPGAFVPDCDERGNYNPKQCHGSTGYCWCVNEKGQKIVGTETPPGQPSPTCEEEPKKLPCLKERQEALGGGHPVPGAFVPDCDERGNYNPKQCHGSTGYCWCVNEKGQKIVGTETPPGQPSPTCEEEPKKLPCLKERQEALGGGQPLIGAFVPDCDERGNYNPKQCHGSIGYCWCVNEKGQKIVGTETPPGQPSPTCEEEQSTPCLKHRQSLLGGNKPKIGAFVPKCDEKGDYIPKQCHGSTGQCWCVNTDGEEIAGTRTGPGKAPPTCEDAEPVTCHYAVAVVKKSSTLQFDQLKGKRSCHSAVGTAAGWAAPLNALMKRNLLVWKGPKEKTIEKAASEFFLSSCAPGAKETNLCKQCAGKEANCKHSSEEPYYGDEGAFKCLRDDKGDVAFVENSVLSEEHTDSFELLCPDNTRKQLSQYKDCNFGKVPRHAVVTRSSGDKIKDITEYLLGAQSQKKECELFSSTHGKRFLFEDTTTNLIALPSAMDTFLFLGPELFDAMKALHGEHPPSKNEVRWCTLSEKEKLKCDDWSSVSGGAIKCTEPSLAEECIEKVLKGEADVVSLSKKHMYAALTCGLIPAFEEYHNKDDFGPCQTPGTQYTDFGMTSNVALVKKKDQDITWNNLKGKKSCHPEVDDSAGWVDPLILIKKQTKSCDLGSFFSKSCAPGSAIDSNLCELCIGDSQNSKANTKCSRSDKEAYYGNDGAIRCLVEKGDVAFVPHFAVSDNTDGKNPALWAKNLKSSDFELLCPDGSRAPVSDHKKCKLGGASIQTVVCREDRVSDVVRIIQNQQSLYGRKGFQKDIFQIFSSRHGRNILFHDDTQCLVDFDRVKEIDIMYDFFGKEHYDSYKESRCFPPSALTSACSFHH